MPRRKSFLRMSQAQLIATLAQIELIKGEVLRKVNISPEDFLDDACIQRYFRATGGDEKSAVNRIADTLKWRQETRPDRLDCPACLTDPQSHYFHLCGFDQSGRPVLYSNFLLVGNRSVPKLVEHMIQMFELTIQFMPAGVEQWVWLNDFVGFGIMDCNPSLGLSFIELLASHYPERLGKLLVLDAPALMTPVWSMIKPFVDPVTHKKIKFLPDDSHQPDSILKRELSMHLDLEMVTWVLDEMKAVRTYQEKKGPRPAYDLKMLKACVQGGFYPGSLAPSKDDAANRMQNSSNQETLKHNHYGSTSFLRKLVEEPHLLAERQ
ncbi:hypothetical protein CEUSTIGMA_g5613.t1 [Chlamydomonas eustigma]|uniref:CRAL-TRIO domain-containing protein n=1 Tax=Chlamydomonas eustigma TaxID=1157962 RepID=A0A250X522_9CHLO|nr:hypothetical protein CEUSTIGMA_g5613.t1 [Chlamydomonas eustigma]|eukprot:GAX78171.1 hypothetical protein CEUSTIGMA_g5613.t1 [Chlamydomonas eustigma]